MVFKRSDSHPPATKILKFVITSSSCNFLITQIFTIHFPARVLIYDEPAILIDYIASIARKNLVYVFCGRLRSIKTPSQTREGVNVPDKKHREILWGKTCKMNRTEPNGRRLPSKRTTSGRCYTLIGRR